MIKSEPRMRPADGYVSLPAPADDLAGRVGDRLLLDTLAGSSVSEESLVVDDRGAMRPAQAVEHKLSRMLREAAMPISHLQTRGILRAR